MSKLSDRTRSTLVLVARLATSVAMLAFLVHKLPSGGLSAVVPTWDEHTAVFLGGALFLTVVGMVLSAVRWQQVAHVLGVDAPFRALLVSSLAGQFVSTALPLPSTIGGDALRVSRLSAQSGQTESSFASVVLERLTGWLVLPLITLFALFINPELRRLGRASQVALATALVTLGALVVVLTLAGSRRIGGRLPADHKLLRFAAAIHDGLEALRANPLLTVWVLAAGFAYQLAVVFASLLAAQALGLDVGPTAMLAFVPAVAIAQVLPVFLSGHGIREAAFALFLTPLGVDPAQAVALGLLVYVLTLAASLLGAPAFAVRSRSTKSASMAA